MIQISGTVFPGNAAGYDVIRLDPPSTALLRAAIA